MSRRPDSVTGTSRIADFLERLSRQRSVFESPRVRRTAMLLAALVFLAGLAWALAAHPDLVTSLDARYWLLVLACVPLTITANSAQFWITARFVDSEVRFPRAVLVTIIGTAANMLPLPGASIVRIAALKNESNTYRQTTLVTVLIAGCWLGLTLLVAGAALAGLGVAAAGGLCAAAGLAALAVFGRLLMRARSATTAGFCALLSVQLATVAIGALRLWLCFQAIGEPVAFLKAAILTLATVIAAFIGIAPAGLGITESLAAGIGAAIGVPASFAFVAAALNRISGLLIVGPLAILMNVLELGGTRNARPGQAEQQRMDP